jgi:hypothetical protein
MHLPLVPVEYIEQQQQQQQNKSLIMSDRFQV